MEEELPQSLESAVHTATLTALIHTPLTTLTSAETLSFHEFCDIVAGIISSPDQKGSNDGLLDTELRGIQSAIWEASNQLDLDLLRPLFEEVCSPEGGVSNDQLRDLLLSLRAGPHDLFPSAVSERQEGEEVFVRVGNSWQKRILHSMDGGTSTVSETTDGQGTIVLDVHPYGL